MPKMVQLSRIALMALALMPGAYSEEQSTPQSLSPMPQCAQDCLLDILPKVPCQLTNQTCMCESPVLKQAMSVCLTTHCAVKDSLLALNITATECHAPIRDRSQPYIITSNVLGVASALFVVERFAYKLWAQVALGGDDWMTLIALLIGIPNTIINAIGAGKYGMGRDIWTLQPSSITNFTRYFFILEIFYFLEVAMLKLSLLLFYVRIFPTKWAQRLLWATLVVCIMFGISFVVAAIFQCTPISFYWTRWDGEHDGKCLDVNAIAWSNASISIALDGWMLAIPLWQLRDLNLDWRRKAGVAMMFCVGTLVTIVSILRLRSLVTFGSNTSNPTWDFFDAGLWSTVEINVGIICVCLPSLRLLLVRLFPQLRSKTQRYYDKSGSNNHNPSASVDTQGGRLPLREYCQLKDGLVSPV